MEQWLAKVFAVKDALDLYSPIWNSWIGLLCVLVIAASCAFNIYSNWVDDSLADRLYYWAMLITSFGALLSYVNKSTNPKILFQTYMILIAIRFVSNILEKVVWHFFICHGRRKE